MPYRIALSILMLVSAVAFPVFILLILGIVGLILYKNFYEIVPLYFINDVMYAIPQSRFLGFTFVMTALAIVLIFVAHFLHRRVFQSGRLTL
jgi:hypothetical protein